MAVLVEAICVIVKVAEIDSKYPGGNEAFSADAPNDTLCADGELARVSFMTPDDLGAFIDSLEAKGLVHVDGGTAADFVVADQQRGFTSPCDWAEVGRIAVDEEEKQIITACQLVDSKVDQMACPEGWQYEGSTSHTFGYVPTDHVDRSLVFLRKEGLKSIFINTITGEEIVVGPTNGDGTAAVTSSSKTQ